MCFDQLYEQCVLTLQSVILVLVSWCFIFQVTVHVDDVETKTYDTFIYDLCVQFLFILSLSLTFYTHTHSHTHARTHTHTHSHTHTRTHIHTHTRASTHAYTRPPACHVPSIFSVSARTRPTPNSPPPPLLPLHQC